MRYIFTGFSPNTRAEDVLTAFKCITTGGDKTAPAKLETWFKEYYGVKTAFAVDSGRSALQIALQAGGIGKDDEVVLQAFTCIVVANAITNLGAKPVYVDCNEQYLIDADKVEAAITPKTKALIIQHTFGAGAEVNKLMAIARKHNLLVVEDCAHSLGGYYNGQLLGTFGDLAIFSFGSDKVISGVRGGMVITNNQQFGENLAALQAKLPSFPKGKELQHLLHPTYFFWGKKMYHLGIGKIKLYLAKKLRLINRIIDESEKKGRVPNYFPAQLPASLATLALNQIKNLDTWNKKRQEHAAFYAAALKNKKSVQSLGTGETWLRFPVQVTNPKELFAKAKANHIILGDWYATPIAPADSSEEAANYRPKTCPIAEKLGQGIVNLPTDPSLSQADLDRIVALF